MRRQFDIAASLSETLDLLVNSTEVTVITGLCGDIEPSSFRIYGDPDQIRQVFWNLARNAMQAMPSGGELAHLDGNGSGVLSHPLLG